MRKEKVTKELKQSKGITLIALIITIIVLLILAGVTIAAINSNESAPNKAVEARTENQRGAAKDSATLLVAEKMQGYYEDKYVNRTSNAGTILDYLKSANVLGGTDGVTTGEYTVKIETNPADETTGKITVTKGTGANAEVMATGIIDASGKITWDSVPNVGDAGNQSGEQGGTDPVNPNPPAAQTVATLRTEAITNGTVSAINQNGNETITDDLGNEVKIPKGFGIAKESGTKIEDGIVIEDATSASTAGSQFVWVPVGTFYKGTPENKTTETVTLGRYTFTSSGTNAGAPTTPKQEQTGTTYTDGTVTIGNYYSENASESTARNLANFVNSAITNKGYYIARCEAGVKGTESINSDTNANYSIVTTNDFTKDSTTANSIVTKPGLAVWNKIGQSNAKTVSQNMYGEVKDSQDKILFTSDLVNSYAWDTAILFIQKCGTKNNSAKYSNQSGQAKSIGIGKTGLNPLKSPNEIDEQCHILDMAGNVREWSTEHSSNSGYPCVNRGGVCSDDNTTSRRLNASTTTSYTSYIGFRPLLYL